MNEDNKTKFEYQLFDLVIKMGLVIWSLRVIKQLIWDTTYIVAILDGFQLFICVLSLFLIKKGVALVYLIRAYCIIWIVFFPLYWVNLGGFEGPMTYAYFSLMVVYNGILRRSFRYVLVSLLSLMCLFLVFDNQSSHLIGIAPYDHQNHFPIELDFVINTILVALIIIYTKTSFDKKRGEIKSYNKNLEVLNIELIEKRALLKGQQEEIIEIRNNLEKLIMERTTELQEKTKQLEEYAYVNAHHVRGPLTNILSVINLVDSRPELYDKEDLSAIKKHAQELDVVIKKINLMLH